MNLKSLRFSSIALLLALAPAAFAQAPAAPATRQEISVAADVLTQYVGTYTLGPGVNLVIRLEGTQLSVQLSGQPEFPVFAQTETLFFLKVVDATLEFQKGADGAVTSVTLTQNGMSIVAQKTSNDVPAPIVEITLSEEVLARYVGSYMLAPNFILTVTLENGQLITQATGQGKVPIFPETETRFFPKVIEATIEFQVDAAGVVTGLVLNQNGRSMPAPKQ